MVRDYRTENYGKCFMMLYVLGVLALLALGAYEMVSRLNFHLPI